MYKDYLEKETISILSKKYNQNSRNKVLSNAIIKNGINDVSINQDSINNMYFDFSEEIEVGKVTNQKSSGRCWMFAALNNMRYGISKYLNMKDENFELSQAYSMFWDKLEKANLFLENIIETREEEINSRNVMWILDGPMNDGGQWDMFVGLIEKYGIVPKYVMKETYHSSNSSEMNRLLTLKLRKNAKILRDLSKENNNIDFLRDKKVEMIEEIYQMLCYFLGEPPQKFTFEYRDKDGKFNRIDELTPLDFYQTYSQTKMNDYISIINAPTADKPFNKTYTVKFLGSVKEGKAIKYLNLDIEMLKNLSIKQLQDGEPVWFGCDVGKMSNRDYGIMDTQIYNYEDVFDISFDLSKGDRLIYGESLLTHAMVFTGVNLNNQKPTKWKVQNSWGEKPGNKGFFIMSDKWFEEFNYEVVINKKYLSKELLEIYKGESIVLDPWDPMGSLARAK